MSLPLANVTPPCRLVIFDKDGTLLDGDQTWLPVIQRCAAELAHVIDPATLLTVLGCIDGAFAHDSVFMTAPTSEIESRLRGAVGDVVTDAYNAWMTALRPEDTAGAAVVPLSPLITAIKARGMQVAVLTNDERRFTEAFLREHEVLDAIDHMVACDDGLPGKPSATPALELCRRAGVRPEEAAIVGDSSRDVLCGLAAELGSVVGVTTGMESGAQLTAAGAHAVLPDVSGVLEILLRRAGAAVSCGAAAS